jgi:phosphatidylinositol alpha-mannosyltransferase
MVTPLGNSIPTAANGSVAPIAPDPACALRTIRALWDEDFDVVHLHEPLAPGPTMTAVVLGGPPSIGTFHAAGASLAYEWLAPVTRWMARRITVKCAVSEDARRLAAESLGGDYVLLHNGVEIERYAKATPWPTDGRPTVLFVGRHEPRKGLAVLLDAVRELPREVRVWVAGDGPETRALQAQVAGDARIEWLGRIHDDELSRRLRAADVFCAPSLAGESFGVVLLEAMAAQTPIVASDIPGYRNVARPDQEAVLVPPGDATALAAALQRVLTDPSRAASLVAAGEVRAAEFAMDRLAERYAELYDSVSPVGLRPTPIAARRAGARSVGL